MYTTPGAPEKDLGARQNMLICFALDVELMLYHDFRLVETRAGAVITGDWARTSASSMALTFFYANHGYRHFRVEYDRVKAEGKQNFAGEDAITARGYVEPFEDNIDLWLTSASELRATWFEEDYDYDRLCSEFSIKQPTRIGEPKPLYGIVDELVPKSERRPPVCHISVCCKKTSVGRPLYATMTPTDALERSESRFDLEKLDPKKEGAAATRWKIVEQLEIPTMQCPRCKNLFAEAFLMHLLRTPAQHFNRSKEGLSGDPFGRIGPYPCLPDHNGLVRR